MRHTVVSKAHPAATVMAAAILLALVPLLPAYAAEVVGGTTPTAPCTQDSTTGALACQDGSRVGGDGPPGQYAPGWNSSGGGQGNATGNTAIGVGSTAGMGGQGSVGTAGGVGGQGGNGGTYNLAFGAGSSAGNGGQAGKGMAAGTGGTGGNGGNYNIALGDGSQAGNGGAGLDGCCSFHGTDGTPGTDNNIAIGRNAQATGGGSVVLGYGSSDGGLANVVSVGSATVKRRITNVAAGVANDDAVNLGQLNTVATSTLNAGLAGVAGWLGGGASYAGGVFTAPTYSVQGGTHHSVGSALGALDAAIGSQDTSLKAYADAGATATLVSANSYTDAREAAIRSDIAAGDATTLASANSYTDAREAGIRGDIAASGAAANSYTDAREVAIRGDMAAGDAATLSSANQYTDQQVANGQTVALQAARAHADAGDVATLAASNGYTDAHVAAARAHADAGDVATLASANQYTDNTATQTLRSAQAYTDAALAAFSDDFTRFNDGVNRRFHEQDRRIDRMGAMTSAMTNMAMNAAGGQSARGRIAVGAGFQGGEQALSVGYGRRIGTRGSFSLGGAFGGGEKSAGVGFGMDL